MTEEEKKKQREKILKSLSKLDNIETCPNCLRLVSVINNECPICKLKFDNGEWIKQSIKEKEKEEEDNDDWF